MKARILMSLAVMLRGYWSSGWLNGDNGLGCEDEA